jgi:hypothetical protein
MVSTSVPATELYFIGVTLTYITKGCDWKGAKRVMRIIPIALPHQIER